MKGKSFQSNISSVTRTLICDDHSTQGSAAAPGHGVASGGKPEINFQFVFCQCLLLLTDKLVLKGIN